MVRTFQNNNASSLGPGGTFKDDPPKQRRRKSLEYDEILNEKRRQENRYRNGDPYVRDMKPSVSEGFLARNTFNNTFGNGLDEIAGTLSRLTKGLDDSDHFPIPSVFNPYAPEKEHYGGGQKAAGQGGGQIRETSWSAPQSSNYNGYQPPQQQQHANQQFGDPMQHMRGGDRRSRGGYSPSTLEGRQMPRRGNKDQSSSRNREPELEWWEKRDNPIPAAESPTKPHPSQQKPKTKKRSENRARSNQDYDEMLKRQIEEKERQKEEEKRKEIEEDRRMEQRILEQQMKIKAEYEEEQAKKVQKEQAKIKRQEEFLQKQTEIQNELAKEKQKEEERKKKERQAAANKATAAARNSMETPEVPKDFRSNSPPVPSMRGKKTQVRDDENGGDDVVGQLSNMREQLQRKEVEHEDVWNDLVD